MTADDVKSIYFRYWLQRKMLSQSLVSTFISRVENNFSIYVLWNSILHYKGRNRAIAWVLSLLPEWNEGCNHTKCFIYNIYIYIFTTTQINVISEYNFSLMILHLPIFQLQILIFRIQFYSKIQFQVYSTNKYCEFETNSPIFHFFNDFRCSVSIQPFLNVHSN